MDKSFHITLFPPPQKCNPTLSKNQGYNIEEQYNLLFENQNNMYWNLYIYVWLQ